jgi:hypothetical protein
MLLPLDISCGLLMEGCSMTLEKLLRSFLLPVAAALLAAESFTISWTAPGPWRRA